MNTKVIVIVLVVGLGLPLLVTLWPKPMTVERVQKAFEKQGLSVTNVLEAPQAGLEAVRQTSMSVDGASVDLYEFDDEGKIAKQLVYQQPDPGAALVEASGLAQALGAAPASPVKTDAARKRMFMITVSSEDGELRARIIRAFKSS